MYTIRRFFYLFSVTLLIFGCGKKQGHNEPLKIYVGGTMQPVMKAIKVEFEKKYDKKVVLDSKGSGELLAQIKTSKEGDIYVSHDPFMDILMKKEQLGVDAWVVSELVPVIVVQKGNPKKIAGLQDLLSDDVDLYLTDYKKSTLGRMLNVIFAKAGIDLATLRNSKDINTNRSGGYVANMVQTKNADAAICWRAVATLRKKDLDIITIPSIHLPTPYVDAVTSATKKSYPLCPVRVTISTLKCSKQGDMAAKFAKFAISKDAQNIFKEFGYNVNGLHQAYKNGRELRATNRILTIFAGAGLRKVMKELTSRFEEISGITVIADYAGSGTLITKVRENHDADLFIPGDEYYVDRLHELTKRVNKKSNLCEFRPVIIVAKGNPKGIKSLHDFFKKEITVGIGNPKATQIGRICQQLFVKHGLDLAKLDAKLSLTVNDLAVWQKSNNCDCAIVWDAIANNIRDDVDIIEIAADKNIISKVVIGKLSDAPNSVNAQIFMEFCQGEDGKRILKKAGYHLEDSHK